MRRLGTVPSLELAGRFAAALRHRGLGIEVREESGGAAIWVHDEDRLGEAKVELNAFAADPHSERFTPPTPPPTPGREGKPVSQPRLPRDDQAIWKKAPVTVGLIGMSVVITVVLWGNVLPSLRGDLSIAPIVFEGGSAYWIPSDGLSAVRSGEVWRTVTPIFPHGDLLHLLGNMAFLWMLGSAIEAVRGRARLLALVLVTAALSNIAEYYLNFGLSFDLERGLQRQTLMEPDPFFLGMSGVVFGLFGYIWMRSRLFRYSGFAMPRDMVTWMLIWLVVCTTGLVGPIANVAHAAGLIVGMMIGAFPKLWRSDKLPTMPPAK